MLNTRLLNYSLVTIYCRDKIQKGGVVVYTNKTIFKYYVKVAICGYIVLSYTIVFFIMAILFNDGMFN